MDKNDIKTNKRSFSKMITDTNDKNCDNLQPPLKKQKIINEKNEHIALIDNYHAPTFVCSGDLFMCINENRELVTLGGLVYGTNTNEVILQNKSIICNIGGEKVREIAFYDYYYIFITSIYGKLMELQMEDQIEDDEFISDIDLRDYIKNHNDNDNYIVSHLSGEHTSIFNVTNDGILHSFGNNYAGLLGSGNKEKDIEDRAENIIIPNKVTIISSDASSAICKTEDGDFYAWGNATGEILPIDMSIHTPDEEGHFIKPVLCSNMPKHDIISIKISSVNIIFLTNEGLVYKCGFESIDDKGNTIYSRIPKLIENIPPIKKISSCYINFCLLDINGNLWTFTKYDNYNLAVNSVNRVLNSDISLPFIPTMEKRCDVKDVIDMSKNGYQTFIKTQNGNIFYFYYNNPCSTKCEENKKYDSLYQLNESPDIWRTNQRISRQKSARK